jgi:hypothetical protein
MGGDYRWPTVERVREFRLKVKELILNVIDRTPLELPVKWDSPIVNLVYIQISYLNYFSQVNF